jgi:hypothetical protein
MLFFLTEMSTAVQVGGADGAGYFIADSLRHGGSANGGGKNQHVVSYPNAAALPSISSEFHGSPPYLTI